MLFEIALEYAKHAREAGGFSQQSTSHHRETQHRRFLRDALAMVRAAIADGFEDAERLRSDPALELLRPLPGFQDLLLDLVFPDHPFAPPWSGPN